MLALAASSIPAMGPCAIGSWEIWGVGFGSVSAHARRLHGLYQGAALYLQLPTDDLLWL
jgi:hypothetical protein